MQDANSIENANRKLKSEAQFSESQWTEIKYADTQSMNGSPGLMVMGSNSY